MIEQLNLNTRNGTTPDVQDAQNSTVIALSELNQMLVQLSEARTRALRGLNDHGNNPDSEVRGLCNDIRDIEGRHGFKLGTPEPIGTIGHDIATGETIRLARSKVYGKDPNGMNVVIQTELWEPIK
jgi:hypothetical protein